VSDYCCKRKSLADSLSVLGYAISDHNLILNVLQGLNKRYDHLHAIIMHNTPFLSFYKVRDDLVLEELTLGPNTPMPPSHKLYSNNTPAPSPPAPSHPPDNGGQGQGEGRDRGRNSKNGGGNSGGDSGGVRHCCNTSGQGNKGQGRKPNPAVTSWLKT
jgi:hypothetical protein